MIVQEATRALCCIVALATKADGHYLGQNIRNPRHILVWLALMLWLEGSFTMAVLLL